MGVNEEVYIVVMLAIASFIGYIVYNRGFKFKLDKLIPMISSIVIGALIALILTLNNM